MITNKSKTLKFPCVPDVFLGDFVRGYFDGDGNILFKQYFRKNRQKFKYYFAIKFISGSIGFLNSLRENLSTFAALGKGSLYVGTRSFVLSYAMQDSKKLCEFMYENANKSLFLKRKYDIYKHAIDILGR